MATPQLTLDTQSSLLHSLTQARKHTDEIFGLLKPEAFYDRPIPERHRLIFYLGHLEAFDWNLLREPLALEAHDPEFDTLFAFGIDPVDGGLPSDKPSDWPSISRVREYNRGIRERIDAGLDQLPRRTTPPCFLTDGTLLHVAIEHRLMHAETLAYLLHNLPLDRKVPPVRAVADTRRAPTPRQTEIPEGIATLGQRPTFPRTFGWDNEFGEQRLRVPEFSIDVFPVTNAAFLKFVQTGGYHDPACWRREDWQWKQRRGLEHPYFWVLPPGAALADPETAWQYRAMFGTIPLPPSWPVYVSYAEAAAYARWAGKKLPTEAQWHRAAYGTPSGIELSYPWGNSQPDSTRGNFDHAQWDPSPVDAHPAGASAWGIFDLIGNGWEWTSTPFGPFPGFEPFVFYPGYSANFFDGKHFVMKGGSLRTDAGMLRRSFRNWFQPHYPYIYATFRCVEE